jgi:hypothetical protein
VERGWRGPKKEGGKVSGGHFSAEHQNSTSQCGTLMRGLGNERSARGEEGGGGVMCSSVADWRRPLRYHRHTQRGHRVRLARRRDQPPAPPGGTGAPAHRAKSTDGVGKIVADSPPAPAPVPPARQRGAGGWPRPHGAPKDMSTGSQRGNNRKHPEVKRPAAANRLAPPPPRSPPPPPPPPLSLFPLHLQAIGVGTLTFGQG